MSTTFQSIVGANGSSIEVVTTFYFNIVKGFNGASIETLNTTYFGLQKGFNGVSIETPIFFLNLIDCDDLPFENSVTVEIKNGLKSYVMIGTGPRFPVHLFTDMNGQPIYQTISLSYGGQTISYNLTPSIETTLKICAPCPTINEITWNEQTMIVNIGSPANYEFKLDDRPWESFETIVSFNDVSYGTHLLKIKNLLLDVECEYCIFAFALRTVDKKSMTLSYSLDSEKWVSFHDYIPNLLFSGKRTLESLLGRFTYSHSSNRKGEFYGIAYPSYIDLPFKGESETNHFTTVNWATEAYSPNKTPVKSTIDDVSVRNAYQTTGIISVKEAKAKYHLGRWHIGELRDIAIENKQFQLDAFDELKQTLSGVDLDRAFYEKGQLISPYCIVRLSMNSTDSTIMLYQVDVTSKPINQ